MGLAFQEYYTPMQSSFGQPFLPSAHFANRICDARSSPHQSQLQTRNTLLVLLLNPNHPALPTRALSNGALDPRKGTNHQEHKRNNQSKYNPQAEDKRRGEQAVTLCRQGRRRGGNGRCRRGKSFINGGRAEGVGGWLPLTERRHTGEGDEVRREERGEGGKFGGEGIFRMGFVSQGGSKRRRKRNVPRGFSLFSSSDAASRQRTCFSWLFKGILALSSIGICMYLALHFCANCFAAAHDDVFAAVS